MGCIKRETSFSHQFWWRSSSVGRALDRYANLAARVRSPVGEEPSDLMCVFLHVQMESNWAGLSVCSCWHTGKWCGTLKAVGNTDHTRKTRMHMQTPYHYPLSPDVVRWVKGRVARSFIGQPARKITSATNFSPVSSLRSWRSVFTPFSMEITHISNDRAVLNRV